MPRQLTGVDANIVLLYGRQFPTGAHKVGAAYSVLVEKELFGEVDPRAHMLFGPRQEITALAAPRAGSRMGFDSLVVLPEGMSAERFQRIESYGRSCH